MDTKLIAEQLGVKILKRLKGAEVLSIFPVNYHVEKLTDEHLYSQRMNLDPGVYLVEKDDQKMVLKTGNFNPNEVEDNKLLSSLGIRTHRVIDSKKDEYILYEYLDFPLLAQKDYWNDENIQRVFTLHSKIRTGLSDQIPSTGARQEAGQWVKDRINEKWLPILVPNVLSEDIAERIKKFYQNNENIWGQLACVYRDNNAEHYVDLSDQLAVLDVDLTFRPKEYMNMRYLSWVLLKAPKEQIGDPVVWAQKWAEYLNIGPEHYATWLLSLVGTLWDIHGNEKTKGEHTDKTENVKKVLEWVMTKLNL